MHRRMSKCTLWFQMSYTSIPTQDYLIIFKKREHARVRFTGFQECKLAAVFFMSCSAAFESVWYRLWSLFGKHQSTHIPAICLTPSPLPFPPISVNYAAATALAQIADMLSLKAQMESQPKFQQEWTETLQLCILHGGALAYPEEGS